MLPFPPLPSIQKARADRFVKHQALQNAGTSRVREVAKIWKTRFAHGTYVGSRHRRDVQLQSMRVTKNKACTSCATLALCVSKKSVYFSHSFVKRLHWKILSVSFSGASSPSWTVTTHPLVSRNQLHQRRQQLPLLQRERP